MPEVIMTKPRTVPVVACLWVAIIWCHLCGGFVNGGLALIYYASGLLPVAGPWLIAALLTVALVRYASRRT
jgi:hypothetical protein